MKLIYLNDGSAVKVDDADYAWLSRHKWYAKSSAYNVYACRHTTVNGRGVTFRMHREIMKCPENKEIDHIDGDTLNNQKANLDIVDKQTNLWRKNAPLFQPNNKGPLTQPQ